MAYGFAKRRSSSATRSASPCRDARTSSRLSVVSASPVGLRPSSSPGPRSPAELWAAARAATGRSSVSSSRLHARLQEQHAFLLEQYAQEQAREAHAADELAHAKRTQSQLWLAVQLAAPVLCALLAGFALGEAIGRPSARGR